MRCYFFTNMYMSAIHAGIQSQHSGQRLCNKYGMGFNGEQNPTAIAEYKSWAKDHETSILINAGHQINLERLINLLESSEGNEKKAWASFNETKDALNGALTSVAVVLDEKIYSYAREFGPIFEKYFNLEQNGELVLNFNSTSRKEVCIKDYTYLTINKDGAILFKAGIGSTDETNTTFNLIEIGIILFMHRLNLCS
jgi:hypothetical protein